tara:strand:- start:3116 stop:3313 length:198 start_codon:yes stop_codon:yes gene_type:complete
MADVLKNNFSNEAIRNSYNTIIAIKVTIKILEILHKSEKEIVITTKRRLIKEDQKIILITIQKGF